MDRYYSDKLAAEKLRKCYEIAPPRVKRYLEAEINHIVSKINPGDRVLEIGCGYGRVLKAVYGRAGMVVGMDTSLGSLHLAAKELAGCRHCFPAAMDAARPAIMDDAFDIAFCIQNGISAIKVEPRILIGEAVRVTRPGGRALFSSYAADFWEERLRWFRMQSEAGLLGEIDDERTGGGVIVCKDGFRATTVSPRQFLEYTAELALHARVYEIDGSAVFCEVWC